MQITRMSKITIRCQAAKKLKLQACLFTVPFIFSVLSSATSASSITTLKELGFQVMDEEIPDLDFEDGTSKTVHLSAKENDGRFKILHFWATWCEPCKKELPQMEQFVRSLGGNGDSSSTSSDSGVDFLPIAVLRDSSRPDVVHFLNGLRSKLPVLTVVDNKAARHFYAWGIPVTLLVSKNRRIIGRVMGSVNWTQMPPEKFKAIIKTKK
jgi:thiol-disulfide isomerase/thioredoxin